MFNKTNHIRIRFITHYHCLKIHFEVRNVGYDATKSLALAIAKAGSADCSDIRDAIREVANPLGIEVSPGEWKKAMAAIQKGEDIDYVRASGPCDFDKNEDVAGAYGNWKVENAQIATTEEMLVKSNTKYYVRLVTHR